MHEVDANLHPLHKRVDMFLAKTQSKIRSP